MTGYLHPSVFDEKKPQIKEGVIQINTIGSCFPQENRFQIDVGSIDQFKKT